MEEVAKLITLGISHALEIIAALVVGAALCRLIFDYAGPVFSNKTMPGAEETRVRFGSAVAVALEILLGADVLATAVAPSWDDLGKLAAIAVLRTALNYFLEKELQAVHHKSNL